MHVGLMEGTIRRKTLTENLNAVVEHGVHHLQYHVPASGPSLAEIRKEMDARQITISALSGTYNMIDPDVEKRQAGLRMFAFRRREMRAARHIGDYALHRFLATHKACGARILITIHQKRGAISLNP